LCSIAVRVVLSEKLFFWRCRRKFVQVPLAPGHGILFPLCFQTDHGAKLSVLASPPPYSPLRVVMRRGSFDLPENELEPPGALRTQRCDFGFLRCCRGMKGLEILLVPLPFQSSHSAFGDGQNSLSMRCVLSFVAIRVFFRPFPLLPWCAQSQHFGQPSTIPSFLPPPILVLFATSCTLRAAVKLPLQETVFLSSLPLVPFGRSSSP